MFWVFTCIPFMFPKQLKGLQIYCQKSFFASTLFHFSYLLYESPFPCLFFPLRFPWTDNIVTVNERCLIRCFFRPIIFFTNNRTIPIHLISFLEKSRNEVRHLCRIWFIKKLLKATYPSYYGSLIDLIEVKWEILSWFMVQTQRMTVIVAIKWKKESPKGETITGKLLNSNLRIIW